VADIHDLSVVYHLNFFSAFFGHTHGKWKFPGQGSNSSHSCNLPASTAVANARSLTRCTTEGTPQIDILNITVTFFLFCFVFVFGLFAFSRAAPAVYGGSQARGLIGAVATGLCQSHSNVGSEPRLRPTPQLTATPDP